MEYLWYVLQLNGSIAQTGYKDTGHVTVFQCVWCKGTCESDLWCGKAQAEAHGAGGAG